MGIVVSLTYWDAKQRQQSRRKHGMIKENLSEMNMFVFPCISIREYKGFHTRDVLVLEWLLLLCPLLNLLIVAISGKIISAEDKSHQGQANKDFTSSLPAFSYL